MSALVISTVMEAIATTLRAGGVTKRVFAYPVEQAEVPWAIVGYPDDIVEQTFHTDATRGADKATFPITIAVGSITGQASRDALSSFLTYPILRTALDGTLGGVVQYAHVVGIHPQRITFDGAELLSAVVDLEVMS